ncbi:type 4 pilus major pilin [Roseateles sp. SL47]|uniref:type 4 pilus major pilin n=1 Tax=Roseateles sp. SL47 TaxID=2995138 RepID=UPI00226FA8DC|nr:type 4 pilus major pilin [Roseateles sp. SL47]WAC74562.1 type 4 pilus major pilin [Roseateles sp. SL47]
MKQPKLLTPQSSRRSRVPTARRQAGASLLEAIAFLGVAATIVVGAVALLSNAFSGARSNRSQEEVAAISTGVKRLFMAQAGAYGNGSLNEVLVQAKVFPSTLAVEGNSVFNAWNGAVTVNGSAATFDISYANVPQQVCVDLVATSGQWISVAVNGSGAMTPPITPVQAAAQCTQANANTVVWTTS